jgi:hypothetical protein
MIIYEDLQEAFNQIDIYFDDEFADLTKEENQVLHMMNKIENLLAEMRCDFNFMGLTIKMSANHIARYLGEVEDCKDKNKFYFDFQEKNLGDEGWVC